MRHSKLQSNSKYHVGFQVRMHAKSIPEKGIKLEEKMRKNKMPYPMRHSKLQSITGNINIISTYYQHISTFSSWRMPFWKPEGRPKTPRTRPNADFIRFYADFTRYLQRFKT